MSEPPLRLRDHIHVVGSATLAASFSHPLDCHVYLLDGGAPLALVDAGGGGDTDRLLTNIRRAGHDPGNIRLLLLTHGHGDHAAGALALRERIDALQVLAPAASRAWIEAGDETALSVAPARAAGLYPPDFAFPACPVDGVVHEDETLRLGGLTIQVIPTPGHCRGHVSLLVDDGRHRDLLAADAVFDGGRIALQPIHDCDLGEQVATLRRLRTLAFDGLFAGHGTPVTEEGAAHVERANRVLDRLQLPPPLVPPDAAA